MKKKPFFLFALCALSAAALLLHAPRVLLPQASPPPAAQASAEETNGNALTLFMDFDASRVSTVTLTTPQVNFDLRRVDERRVSVNGQRGDSEVFATLLDQIAGMTIVPIEAFSVQETPLLTLVIRAQDAEYTASFYDDGGTGEFARIITRTQSAPVYARTDAWRVGTLMLACEGMRVQDAHGQETPLE